MDRRMIGIPDEITERAASFRGTAHHLEEALGAYAMGQLYGWRVLRMMHGTKNMNRSQRILGVKFADVCPERTELSQRCLGIRLADKARGFWRIAEGKDAGRERFQLDDETVQRSIFE